MVQNTVGADKYYHFTVFVDRFPRGLLLQYTDLTASMIFFVRHAVKVNPTLRFKLLKHI